MRVSSFRAASLLFLPLLAPAAGAADPRPVFHEVRHSPVLAQVDSLPGDELLLVAESATLAVLDRRGMPLPGWPVEAPGELAGPPCLLAGGVDGVVQVLCASTAGPILRWSAAGKPLAPLEWGRGPIELRVSPLVADLDGDGSPEAIALAAGGLVGAWRADGRPLDGWPRELGAAALGGPAAAPSADRSGGGLVAAGDESGRLHLFDASGRAVAGWPLELGARIRATPCLLPRSGAPPLVLASPQGLPWRMEAFELDGTPADGWPAELSQMVNDPPAIGDCDGDGQAEIAFSERLGDVSLLRAGGGRSRSWPRGAGTDLRRGLLLGDLDGDAKPDILATGERGELWAWDAAGKPLPGWPRELGAPTAGLPALGDLDADGRVEVVVAYRDGALRCLETDGVAVSSALPWPGERGAGPLPRSALTAAPRLRVWQNLASRRATENVIEFELPRAGENVALALRGEGESGGAQLLAGAARPAGVHRIALGPARAAGHRPGVRIARLTAGADTVEAEILLAP